jgi:hypothetical protein
VTVLSLVDLEDEPVSVGEEGTPLPIDVSSYVNRSDGSLYVGGGFLGRQVGLSNNKLTNTYRNQWCSRWISGMVRGQIQ